MAESNATQVILTDDGIKIIKAQNTADKASGGVANLNDPNLMSVIEKQYNTAHFAGLTSQYNVIIQGARDDGIDTTALTTAYNNLNNFMASVLTDPDHASDVDRVTYKKYQDAYNEELAKIQNALQNNTKNKFTSAANATSQAASTANVAKSAADNAYAYANSSIAVQSTATAKAQLTADSAFSKAQSVGDKASKEIAVQSTATAKAQSKADDAFSKAQEVGNQASAEILVQSTATAKAQETADNAFSKAQLVGDQASAEISVQSTATAKAQETADSAFSQSKTAIDTGNVTSQAVTSLKGGSKLTIAELENGLATKVANSDYASYKTQTASQIGQLVTNGAFSAYQQTTADLIASKVANKDFSAYQATTAKAISSKVESNDFNTYKSQTDKAILSKVANSEFSTYKTQTADLIAEKVANKDFSTYKTQTADLIAEKVASKDFSTYKKQTDDLISQKVATKDFSAYQATTAKSIESKVESKDFNTYKSQTDKAILSKVSSTDFNNLTISNRNLALGTATAFKMTGNNSGNNVGYMYSLSETIAKGTTVTVAFDITTQSPTGTFLVQFTNSSWQFISDTLPLVSGTQHHSYTLVTNADYSGKIQIRLDNSNSTVTVSNFIISESSKEVSWTPAPEDQATQSQITQLSGEIEQKVNSGDFSTYKSQTADLIASKVANKDFSTYQKQTADLIAEKVATKDFSAYQATTAKAISSKVESKDFNTYKTQTDSLINDKVSSAKYTSDKTQTDKDIASKVSSDDFSTYKTQTNELIGSKVSNGNFSTYKEQTADLISEKVATKDFSAYQDTTAKAISSKVESKDFNTYKTQTADEISSKVESSDFQTVQTQVQDSAVGTNLLTGTGYHTVTGSTGYALLSNETRDDLLTLFKGLEGQTVTVSFDYKYSGFVAGSSTNRIGWEIKFIAGSTSWLGPWYQPHNDSGSGRMSSTFVVPKNITDIGEGFGYIQFSGSGTGTVSHLKLEKGSLATDWCPNPEDLATQSQITQLSDDMNLRVTKGDLIDEINLKAGNTLISSSGQLTLSGKNIYFDTANPVMIPSANIDKLLVDKQLKAANISANTFSTNNKTFTVDKNGAITAKNMTLIGGTLTTPTINGSTINGGTLNMQTDGLINSPYNGIQQTADQFYHPWKLNTGQLTIGQGYITSVSSGTRSINGVPKQFNSLRGTLSASYLKFTNDYGARTYIDADMFTYSNQTNDTAMVAISAGGIGINMGTANAPALTISNGYIDASSSSSYGTFGAITLGYNAHTINSDKSIFFESGHGSGNPGINIWAKGFQSLSSRLSTKRQVRLLDDEHSNSLLLGADTITFKYNQDTNADNPNEGVIIDDVNTVKQYSLPDELITRDGKAPTDLMSFIARIISQNKYQARLIEDLQIRLRKVEIKNE